MGIAIWYAMSRHTVVRNTLMALAFIGVPVLNSSVVPWRIRAEFLFPHVVIVIPCVLLWVVMQVELLAGHRVPIPAAPATPAQDRGPEPAASESGPRP
jgi:hypothetical protein